MKRTIRSIVFTASLLFCCTAVFAKTGKGKSGCIFTMGSELLIPMGSDTIPAPAKSPEAATVKPDAEKAVVTVIKEVPKARKVPVPRQVTSKVKPVKVIKPKIVKPVIRIL